VKMGDQSVAVEHQVLLSQQEVEKQLFHLFECLHKCKNFCRQKTVESITKNIGFTIAARESHLPGAGKGVFVATEKISAGQIVALYPGTVYFPEDPKLIQSLNNPYMFRCKDYLHIDGKNWGMSKSIYKSCYHRDNMGVFESCDPHWITYEEETSPVSFNIGQIVNNSTFNVPANVHYQEFDVLLGSMPSHLRKYVPNVNYNAFSKDFIRTVVLVATKDIDTNEELLSSYFTLSY